MVFKSCTGSTQQAGHHGLRSMPSGARSDSGRASEFLGTAAFVTSGQPEIRDPENTQSYHLVNKITSGHRASLAGAEVDVLACSTWGARPPMRRKPLTTYGNARPGHHHPPQRHHDHILYMTSSRWKSRPLNLSSFESRLIRPLFCHERILELLLKGRASLAGYRDYLQRSLSRDRFRVFVKSPAREEGGGEGRGTKNCVGDIHPTIKS